MQSSVGGVKACMHNCRGTMCRPAKLLRNYWPEMKDARHSIWSSLVSWLAHLLGRERLRTCDGVSRDHLDNRYSMQEIFARRVISGDGVSITLVHNLEASSALVGHEVLNTISSCDFSHPSNLPMSLRSIVVRTENH